MVAPPSTHGAAFHPPLLRPGEGGDLLFLAEREQAPPCPVCEAGRWSCHLRFKTTTPQSSPARDTFPEAGLSWSRVCAAKAGLLGDSADGARLVRRLPRRHGWHPWRGARLRKVEGWVEVEITFAALDA